MKNNSFKRFIKVILLIGAGFLINDVIELAIRYFKERIALRDYIEKELDKRSKTDPSKSSLRDVERMAEYVEAMLLKNGAEQVFTSGEEKYKLRRTYKFNGAYYRMSISEIDGEPFLIANATDDSEYADIGIMEEIGAFSPSLSESELEHEVRCLLELEDYEV